MKSILTKIFYVSLLPVIALLVVATINYRYLDSLGKSAELIMSRNYASIKAAQKARQALDDNRTKVIRVIFQKFPTGLGDLSTTSLAEALQTCQQHVAEQGEQQLVENLLTTLTYYQESLGQLSSLATQLQIEEFFRHTLLLTTDLNSLVELNEQGMERAERETRELGNRAQRHSLFFLIGTIIWIILLNYALAFQVARPIRDLVRQLATTRQGGERYPCMPIHSSDETGLLTEEFNRLFKHLAAYDQHNATILAVEKEKVRYAEEAKTRFIADLSHQLKTPMTSLIMGINLLFEKRHRLRAERIAILIDTARDDCNRLAQLINELVDISRLEGMIKPLVRERVDIAALVRESLKPLRQHAEEKGVQLDIDISPHLPPTLLLDSMRFPWVITNLVSNGLRHTKSGGRIDLKIERRDGSVYFSCRDNGCGIDPLHLPRIFDRFTQFSEREKLGTIGLGLAIVKEVIEQHGGNIIAESCPGQGTVFIFWIPESLEANDATRSLD
jgi:signal transduction histidine kinase